MALFGLFALLVLCGIGLPIPEDVLLLTTGLIAHEAGYSWILPSVMMYCAVMAGDSLAFLVGRRFGMRVLAMRWTQRFLTPAKQARIERLFRHYGSAVLFVARFLPGLRAAIFCTAGAMKVRYHRFALFDGAAAIISVPFFVWLGHLLWGKFGDDVAKLSSALSETHSYTLWFTVAVAIVAIALFGWMRLRPARAS